MSKNDNILPRGPGETQKCLEDIISGIQSCIGANEQVLLDSVQYTQTGLTQKVQGYLGLFTNVDDVEAAFHAAVAQRVKAEPEVADFIAALLGYLQYRYRTSPAVLEKFGFRARAKAPAESTVQKAAKVAKAAQTRQKNGTLGKRQKQARKNGGSTPPSTQKGSPA
ncbi:MAG TPA: hypothetical protein VFF73_02215 [Planctomycetota bacterium]|nr:hypothetical protein [Planctomycetota bacterium]